MILDNPFHVLGLHADCTPKEKTGRTSLAKALLQTERPLEFGDSDLVFGGCRRNQATLERAIRDLHHAGDRIRFGLFWFTRGGLLDNVAYSSLRLRSVAGIERALQIWKAVEDRMPTPNYASSFNNFGTLCLLIGVGAQPGLPPGNPSGSLGYNLGRSDRVRLIRRGIRAKAKVIESLSDRDLANFCATFSDDLSTRKIDNIVTAFSHGLRNFAEEAARHNVPLDTGVIIELFDEGASRPFPIRAWVEAAVHRAVEKALRQCANAIKRDKSNAGEAGIVLMDVAKTQVNLLGATIGTQDPKYMALADRVAEALLSASRAHWNHHYQYEDSMGTVTLARECAQMERFARDIACLVAIRKHADREVEAMMEILAEYGRVHKKRLNDACTRAFIPLAERVFAREPSPTQGRKMLARVRNSGLRGRQLYVVADIVCARQVDAADTPAEAELIKADARKVRAIAPDAYGAAKAAAM